MLLNNLYYRVKPLIPRSIRLGVRRQLALRKLNRLRDIWPIMPGSERPPEGWPGWPEGKKFAFVLTHDVESAAGLARVRQLAEMEMELGFRSSFNFVPEADYRVPKELRDWLTGNGFEIGVHDLHHDGKLFRSREHFSERAPLINNYLREWDAVGFRSGFMIRRLNWLHDLDIAYDMSTFDTDPFEPQPEGMNTIFPFWVPRSFPTLNAQRSPLNKPRSGYVELPYTLPQDSTLFLLLREKTNSIWKQKLDWIAEHGGMVLLNTHPDYVRFHDDCDLHTFPASLYEDFLKYAKSKHLGNFWDALPRRVARFAIEQQNTPLLHKKAPSKNPAALHAQAEKKIWIDLDNTPHVPFFKPIITELRRRGFTLVLTARDAFQVCDLAAQSGLSYTKVGRHYGKNPLLKVLGLAWRSMQLLPFVLRQRPLIGLSHGSRAQILLCNLLHIPTIMVMDYEYAQTLPGVRPGWEIVPDLLFSEKLNCRNSERIRTYRGIKEDVYAPDLLPDPSVMERLKLDGDLIVTVRPPATEAHYHNPESEKLFVQLMNRLCNTQGAKAVLLPRNKNQETELRKHWPQWFEDSKVIIPQGAVDGLNLVWHSDLVVSGGGTMNREAAALGVPVYSIFRGKIGAVDRQLQSEGRLMLIESVEQVQRIAFRRRDKTGSPDRRPRQALRDIVDHVEEIVWTEYPGTMPSVK